MTCHAEGPGLLSCWNDLPDRIFRKWREFLTCPLSLPAGRAGGQEYPPAAATHEEVIADPELFQRTLHDLYAVLGIKISKVMRLGGQELNLHLLYQRVTEEGGALQVIKGKHWRDVGDVFKLPKTITSVSFVLKRGYMQYLWDYEQLYFHRRSGEPRVPAPVSRYTKDNGDSSTGGSNSNGALLFGGGGALSDVDAAAAIAVATLRGRCPSHAGSTSSAPHVWVLFSGSSAQ
jgi:hypothetical protein